MNSSSFRFPFSGCSLSRSFPSRDLHTSYIEAFLLFLHDSASSTFLAPVAVDDTLIWQPSYPTPLDAISSRFQCLNKYHLALVTVDGTLTWEPYYPTLLDDFSSSLPSPIGVDHTIDEPPCHPASHSFKLSIFHTHLPDQCIVVLIPFDLSLTSSFGILEVVYHMNFLIFIAL